MFSDLEIAALYTMELEERTLIAHQDRLKKQGSNVTDLSSLKVIPFGLKSCIIDYHGTGIASRTIVTEDEQL